MSKRGANTSFEVNGDKLRKVLKHKYPEMTNAEHSRNMGYESGFIANNIARGRINGVCKKYLESIGITLDMITDKKEEPVTLQVNAEPRQEQDELIKEVRELKEQVAEMSSSIRTIGNLLTQINEKMFAMSKPGRGEAIR